MNKDQTIDRPTEDIIRSVMMLINEQKIKGQLARDLEKLCVAANATAVTANKGTVE